MKTATVADLRNWFSEISTWIREGEEVTITKRGKPFAMLRSAKRPHAPKKPLDCLARLKELNPEGRFSEDSEKKYARIATPDHADLFRYFSSDQILCHGTTYQH